MNLSGLLLFDPTAPINSRTFGVSERASRGRFSRLVICDVPEIRERVVEKPVATLLARTQAFEIARSRRLGSEPGLYKRVGVRVRARERDMRRD